ncbi:MAG: helix-turn-helix transcriptional regulator [Chloroflexota bacterium]|nr:helix-turn-helix transcriptional regulator [Chloroflexota bacterium]
MQDEEFRTEYERLGPGFGVAKLRTLRGLTQEELADRVGTHQSSISRLESGEREPSLSFLRRVVEALDGRLEIRVMAKEEVVTVGQETAPTKTMTWQVRNEPCPVIRWTDRQPTGVPMAEREMMPA